MKIPKEWEMTSLSKVAIIQTGLAKGKKNQKNIVSLPYLRVANVQDGYLDLSEIKEIEIDRGQVSRYLLQNEDILLTEGGDFDKLGRGSIWHCQIDPCLHQNHIFAVRVDRERLSPYFFSQQISSFYGKTYFLHCAKQTTNLASINSTQLKEFPVVLPPLKEQQKIAEVIGSWDKAIDLLEKLIAAKRKLKQGLMQQLLTGKKRFKEFVDNSSRSTNNIKDDRLPEGWVKLPIGKLCRSIVPGRNKPKQFDGDIPWVTTPNINQKYILKDNVDLFVSEEEIKKCGGKIVPEGAVIINCVGDFGMIGIVKQRVVINQQLHAFVCSEDLDNEYVFYALSIQTHYMSKVATTTTIPYMNKSSCESIPILLPPLIEQYRIASVLVAADIEISILKKQLDSYKQQKRGLMQQLLTGKKRLN
jgi:type I restriction enzyme, S subunit